MIYFPIKHDPELDIYYFKEAADTVPDKISKCLRFLVDGVCLMATGVYTVLLIGPLLYTSPELSAALFTLFGSGAILFAWWRQNASKYITVPNSRAHLLASLAFAVLFAVPGVISGNPWMMFMVASPLILNTMYMKILIPSLIIMLLYFLHLGTMFASILGIFPAIVTAALFVEYMLQESKELDHGYIAKKNHLAFLVSLGALVFSVSCVLLDLLHINILHLSSMMHV